MSSQRRQFDGDYKIAAVRLVEESERTLTEVARSLGIHGSMLRRWRSQVRKGGGQAFAESGRQERSELQRLQRENKRLQRDLEMLKKTIAYIESRRP